MFKTGDRVRRKNPSYTGDFTFSNGELVVTVSRRKLPDAVWFKETDTWLECSDLILENPLTKESVLDGI